MVGHLLGQVCALAAAVTWAFALVLFKRSGERVPPLALNLFKNTVGLLLFAVTLVVLGHGFGVLREQAWQDVWQQMLWGIVGIALADTAFFAALNRIGVGLISIVDCLYSPFVIAFAWMLLGEQLSATHYVGGGLVLIGVLISSHRAPLADRTRGQIVLGVLLGVLAMALMTFSIVIVKPILVRFPLVWAATLRLLGGTVALALLTLVSPRCKAHWSVFRPAAVWKHSVPASFLGAYVALLLWMAGFTYTHASIAAILNQTSVIFALILASVMLKEPFTRRKLISAILAIGGVTLIALKAVVDQLP